MKKINLFLFTFGFIIVGSFLFFTPKAQAVAINGATKTNVTPGTQFSLFKGVPVFRLLVNNTGGTPDTITSLSPTPSGTVNDTLITLHFYNDLNNNGYVDQGDTNLGASAAFAVDDTIKTFDITDVAVAAGGSASIIVTADGTGALLNTENFTLSFAAGTSILMTVEPLGTFPLTNANALTISTSVPSVTIADGANDPAAPHTAAASDTNVVVKQLAISAAAGTSDSVVSIAPTPTGTENDTLNISSVGFYIDSGSALGQFDVTDIPLVTTPATYTANDVRTVFTFSSPVQVAAGSTVNILMVYNLGAGVTPANTLYAQIAAVGDVIAGSGTALNGNTSTISDLITISGVAANIAIASSKITSPNTVLVTFVDPSQNISSVDYTKWHIDVGDGGDGPGGPLTPASAVVTSAGTPWTVTLTFSGTPFSDTAKTYSTAEGLYVDASGVTDTNGDTNVVVGHAASTAITDGQSPTFTAERTALNTIVLTFSEAVDAAAADETSAWTVAGGTVTAVTDPANTTTLTITTTGLTSTSSTPAVAYVAASGTVADVATNEVANAATANASDGVPPTFTAVRTGLNAFVLTFSETVTSGGVDTDSFTVVGASAVSAGVVVTNTSITLTTTGLTDPASTPAINYVAATGDVADAATNEVANGGAVVPTDESLPTIAITMSDYALGRGETSIVTFTFSEAPTGFANADVTVANGTISTVTVDGGDAKIYTATFTPTANISDDTNVITVGTGWTDAATNAPAGTTDSANYTVSTRSSSGGGSMVIKPAIPANTVPPLAECLAGQLFSVLTGRNCNAATPAVVCSPGHIFKTTTGERCSSWITVSQSAAPGASGYAFGNTTLKNGSRGEAVKELQRFLNFKLNLGLVVDGKLGSKTIAVIKKWQRDNGLVEDGLVGPKTKAKMHSTAQ